MVEQTIDLIQRVEAILGVHNDFLDAVCEWYSNVSLARKVFKLLAPRPRAGARVSLTVNGCLLAGEGVTVTPQARNVTWQLAPGVLAAGDNELAVYVEKAGRPLLVQAVMAYQEGVFPWQTVDLTAANSAPTAHLSLAGCGGERRGDDGWELKAGGYLTCRLQLPAALPAVFSLALPAPEGDDWFDDFKDVLDDVEDRIKDKLKELEEEQRRVARTDPAGAGRLQSKITDLNAYARLQRAQIAPALCGGGSGTLAEVIQRTGQPDSLIAPWLPPRPVRPATTPPVPLPPPVPRPYVPARTAPRPAPKSGCASACLTVLFLGALALAGLAYVAWNYLPKPVVRFDSLAEGQTVAAGAPLQVWVSGEDLLGVNSVSLSVESGGDLVQTLPSPAELPFNPGTIDTGTHVFTLNFKPYGGEARTITLLATLKSTRGTTTTRRAVKVGGREQALVFEINPTQPKVKEKVQVIVHAVNVPVGSKIRYTVDGDDSKHPLPDKMVMDYHKDNNPPQEALTVAPDGTIRFEVDGALTAGVQDVIEARLEGTNVHQSASYHFGD